MGANKVVSRNPTLITLGAGRNVPWAGDARFQSIDDFEVQLITDKYWTEVFVVDTFIYPTKALAVLTRREVERLGTLGLVPQPPATSMKTTGRR